MYNVQCRVYSVECAVFKFCCLESFSALLLSLRLRRRVTMDHQWKSCNKNKAFALLSGLLCPLRLIQPQSVQRSAKARNGSSLDLGHIHRQLCYLRPMKWVYINDAFLPEEKAVLSLQDLALARGYGVFDFFRLHGSVPLFLEDHLQRFYCSARALHLEPPLPSAALQKVIMELLSRNNVPDSGIRLTLTGGRSPDGFQPGTPNLLVTQHPYTAPTVLQRTEGITLASYPHQRQLPHIKSIDYLVAVWLQPWLREQGADDILYHTNGLITECPRSNVFVVSADEVLLTPSEGILQGITRSKVLQLAREVMPVEERSVSLQEVLDAREVFITSTTKGILPVRAVDGRTIGRGHYPMTAGLQKTFHTTFLRHSHG